ncbi:8-oxo-dGTP diphosphatase [Maioricimonas rarisocia]|uniref:8-oxo-dGTP diphosphatase n=1 Tax=Maioricimonas rarisocia TaxID=2528026 RepID=A0A517Z6I2_9PLAN|nr:(deoxy)nucleoside triphosphate pyrophosphohydrolase [Maioricimonas rarisocia]QDU38100.1 8-oxo-dGTP diphosphatase [Maioricimonas rarisocia]
MTTGLAQEDAAPTRIGIAVVEREGRYLVGVRPPGRPLAGMAEFPGGKCELGESAAACAVRECLEETGLRVEIRELLNEQVHEYPHDVVHLHFFLCAPVSGEPREANGTFRWCVLQELAELEFPDANGPVVQQLLDRAANLPGGRPPVC